MTSVVALVRPAGALALLVLLASCAGSARRPAPASPSAGAPYDAIAELQAAQAEAARRPDDPAALFRVGLAWQRRAEAVGDHTARTYLDSARVAYDLVLARDSADVKALVHSGLVLEDLDRGDEALARYEEATKVAPEDPRPHVNLGSLLYFRFRRTYDAKTALMHALSLDPDNADARFNLGVMFADALLYREALTEWERVAAGPEGPARTLARQNLEKIRPLLAAQDSAAAAAAAASGPARP